MYPLQPAPVPLDIYARWIRAAGFHRRLECNGSAHAGFHGKPDACSLTEISRVDACVVHLACRFSRCSTILREIEWALCSISFVAEESTSTAALRRLRAPFSHAPALQGLSPCRPHLSPFSPRSHARLHRETHPKRRPRKPAHCRLAITNQVTQEPRQRMYLPPTDKLQLPHERPDVEVPAFATPATRHNSTLIIYRTLPQNQMLEILQHLIHRISRHDRNSLARTCTHLFNLIESVSSRFFFSGVPSVGFAVLQYFFERKRLEIL